MSMGPVEGEKLYVVRLYDGFDSQWMGEENVVVN